MYNFDILSSDHYIDYPLSVETMEAYVADIKKNNRLETIWFLEHPALYTAGTSACEADLLDKNRFPIFQTGRGGQYTYHGPKQLVAYVMVDIQKRQIGIREYIQCLENSIIQTLAYFNIEGEIRQGRVGVWVCSSTQEDKIAAIGVRVRRGVTYHGIAINIDPDLSAFTGIIPCGIQNHGVTSFAKLGIYVERSAVENIFSRIFIDNINQLAINIS